MPDRNQKSEAQKNSGLSSDAINPEYRPKKHDLSSKEEYIKGIKLGDRATLSRAITLIESSRSDYLSLGQEIVESLLPYSGNSVRLGITGVPGVGKSTFIDAIGKMLVSRGLSVAVLTVDPSSSRSGGSILGDKTRMEFLSSHPNAYIRPSPTSGTLGGVARKTREAMLLCEAAGFDIVCIETVGVGQSETVVKSMVDFFLLLMLAGAGDELQGIKRGIMEMADAIAITKADGRNKENAKMAAREYQKALHLFPPPESGWQTKLVTCSALYDEGIEKVWETIREYITYVQGNGYFEKNRSQQAKFWMYETIHQMLKDNFYQHKKVKEVRPGLEEDVLQGRSTSFMAAQKLLNIYFGK